MQGKELAGQERAAGARGFARGFFDDSHIEHINHLIEGQQRCFTVFTNFARPESKLHWQKKQSDIELADIDQLRVRITQRWAGDLKTLSDPQLADRWFVLTTRRIDAMKAVEEELAQDLRSLCQSRLQAASDRLAHHQSLLKVLEQKSEPPLMSPLNPALALLEHAEGRNLIELLQLQAQRLQQMSDELDAAKTALEDRKLIERAKSLLMTNRSLSEQQAHRLLRQMAMNQSRRLSEIARSVIEMADVWR